jgi:hypothetical protein
LALQAAFPLPVRDCGRASSDWPRGQRRSAKAKRAVFDPFIPLGIPLGLDVMSL